MPPRYETPTGNLFSSNPLLVYSWIYDFAFLLSLLTALKNSITQEKAPNEVHPLSPKRERAVTVRD